MFFMIRERLFLERDDRPEFCIFGVNFEPLAIGLIFRVGTDCVHWALRLAHAAIDALIRMNDEEVLTFIKAVDRTHFNAIRMLAHDAVIFDDIGHRAAI